MTDGFQSYAVFMYHCGLLQWRESLLPNAIGVLSQKDLSSKIHHSIHLMNGHRALVCANLPNEQNTLIYRMSEGTYHS